MDELERQELNAQIHQDILCINSEYYVPIDFRECPQFKDAWDEQNYKCGSITRYCEDDISARAYSVAPDGGYMIIYYKQCNRYGVYPLYEDDGVWFICEDVLFFRDKLDFVARLTEAVSCFNDNFNSIDK